MTAFKRLKALLRNERGNTLLIGAAALPMLMASAGFAIDTIQLGVFKRQMQRAADSSAIAGAYALTHDSSATTAVTRDLAKNKYPTLSEAQQVTVGPSMGYAEAVRVQLTTKPRMPFMSIFTKSTSTVTAEATAALVQDGSFCILSLYEGTDPGIDVGGNATLNLGCGMASNARGPSSIEATGSSWVTAKPIMAVGGLDGDTSNFNGGTKLQPYSPPQEDPYAGVPNPPAQSCSAKLEVKPGDDVDIEPGCFGSMDISGTVNMAPGTYYINGGDLDFGAEANVTGSGVTFVLTGPGGAAGDIKMNGQATLNLSGQTSGDYKGLLFYRDRRASNIEIKINGGADANLSGAMYFPSSDITFTGNAGLAVQCLQLIGQKLKFRGTADITNNCPSGANLPNFKLRFVRLVK